MSNAFMDFLFISLSWGSGPIFEDCFVLQRVNKDSKIDDELLPTYVIHLGRIRGIKVINRMSRKEDAPFDVTGGSVHLMF
jgi:hypothetical protein